MGKNFLTPLRRYKINETYMKYLCNLYICHIEKSIKSMIYEKQNKKNQGIVLIVVAIVSGYIVNTMYYV